MKLHIAYVRYKNSRRLKGSIIFFTLSDFVVAILKNNATSLRGQRLTRDKHYELVVEFRHAHVDFYVLLL